MTRRTMLFGVVAVCAAAGCIRLGIWQLHRLQQRREKNALIVARGEQAPATVASVRGLDTTQLHWRHMSVRAVPDYTHEVVLAVRSQAGTPGVHLITAVKPVDAAWGDTAILVIRGWMPAADGRTFDPRNTREGDTLNIDALITSFPPALSGAVRVPLSPHAFRWLDRDTLSHDMGVPLAPFVLLQLGDTIQRDVTKPVRVPPPSLSEGPHKSYAFQWFGFAAVALFGFAAFVMKDRREKLENDSTS